MLLPMMVLRHPVYGRSQAQQRRISSVLPVPRQSASKPIQPIALATRLPPFTSVARKTHRVRFPSGADPSVCPIRYPFFCLSTLIQHGKR
jgi:hypothetical protein